MKTSSCARSLLGLLLLCLLAGCSGNGDGAFVIDQAMETPEWAQLQRELLAANAEGSAGLRRQVSRRARIPFVHRALGRQ